MAITQAPLTKFKRFTVAFCVFLALLFDGVELGLMPIASLSVTRDLLKSNYSPQMGARLVRMADGFTHDGGCHWWNCIWPNGR